MRNICFKKLKNESLYIIESQINEDVSIKDNYSHKSDNVFTNIKKWKNFDGIFIKEK